MSPARVIITSFLCYFREREIWFESHISYSETLVPAFREEKVPAWGARVLRRQCRVWFVGSDPLAQLRQRGRKCLQK